MVLSLFWKTISRKSWSEAGITEVATDAGPPEGRSWMEFTLKTPGMLKWSASFRGVSALTKETPLTA